MISVGFVESAEQIVDGIGDKVGWCGSRWGLKMSEGERGGSRPKGKEINFKGIAVPNLVYFSRLGQFFIGQVVK